MKRNLLLSVLATVLCCIPGGIFAQAPTLGTAANFVLFTGVGAVTNSGIPHLTHLTGNVGSNSGSSTGFGNVDGVMHSGDGATAACTADLNTLYTQLNTAIPTFFPAPSLGNGDTLIAGVYNISAATVLNLNLYLNGRGDPNALFIFQIAGPLSVNALSKVTMLNSAVACNVFWKVEGLVSIASGATMRGTIVAHNAAINMSANDTLEGRALSTVGAISVNSDLAYTPVGCGSATLTGPAAPALVATAGYGIFSSIGPVTNSGITHVNGDVGTNSGLTTGFDPLIVTGAIHPIPDASTAAAAADLTNVYNYLNTLPYDIELLYPAQFGNDLVLTPHTYLMNAAPTFTGNVYLNAEGNANAVFVIRANGAIATSTLSRVVLMNGAQAKNVYWLINGAVHVYDNSDFNGTIVATGAITFNTGDSVTGRAFTTNGAIGVNGGNFGSTSTSCTAPAITGLLHVCQGDTTTLTDTTTGGSWSSSNNAVATIGLSSGLVTTLTPGNTTITYTTLAGCTAAAIFTVNTAPSPITGPGSVCSGSSITLTDITTGGTWSSSNPAMATVGSASGIVSGVATGTPMISYTTGTGCTATKPINVNANQGAINGPSTVCTGASITLTDTAVGGTWSSSNTNATVASGVVTGVTPGIDTIRYTVTNLCGTAIATKTVTVSLSSGVAAITGPSSVCMGSFITLTDATTGGSWSSSNTSATVVSGIVTGVTAGIDTITYTVTNACGTARATKTITVNTMPNAGSISGPSSVCTGNSITLADGVAGGVWSSSNSSATVSGGTVTGVIAGIDTITYTVTNLCGTAGAAKTITVNALPNAGIISGVSSVCTGNTITLADAAAGGVWSSSNATASVASGTVTGITPGIDTINYTVTNTCGTAIANKTITINALPAAGSITGPSTVCTGSAIVLTDLTAGGTWATSNATASVAGGTVTGITAGTNTISYTVTNTCGTAVATKMVTINPSPNAGSISGSATVCVGSAITLTDVVTGGTWSSSNANASVSPSGIVTGVTAGTDNIMYTVSNISCSATAIKTITINPLPDAGFISSLSHVCVGSSILLTDGVSGGTWSSSNATASVAGGTVTGITAGIDTIAYRVINTCGTATATATITVNPLPDAGVITGTDNVCTGSSITLTDITTAGGTWTSSNATASVAGGLVTGLSAGIDNISYTVTNICGSATATKTITINPTPSAGIISGAAMVCAGSSIILTDAVTGGVWAASNTSATIAGGVVSGMAAGIDTISFSVSSALCTAIATKVISVIALPNAGTIATVSALCAGAEAPLADVGGLPGGTWSESNFKAVVSGAIVIGISAGVDTIRYTVSGSGCSATALKTITINALPNAGTINGITTICSGSSVILTDIATGGTWTSGNAAVAAVAAGTVTGIATGTTSISYTVTNTCGTALAVKQVTVSVTPAIPVITTQSPATVCTGTMYQNFGTASLPPAFTTYSWSATNATVWAQGTGHQYALVSFTTTGTAYVTLTATAAGSSCTSQSTVTINVGTGIAQTPDVAYFNNHFVCTPATEDSYQWGYDDVTSLDSTILTGEINQDYLNTNPDFTTRDYWVMTTSGGCGQKTYYHIPTTVQNINNGATAMTLYPNPADKIINVSISSSVQGSVHFEVLNMLGQNAGNAEAMNNKATINVATLPAGSYLVSCYNDGVKIATARFIKN